MHYIFALIVGSLDAVMAAVKSPSSGKEKMVQDFG